MAVKPELLKQYGDENFHASVPIYLLDSSYCIMGWNLLFEKLIATPLSLRDGQHVGEFIDKFKNSQEVYDRSAKVFGIAVTPHFDSETILIDLPEFGLTNFQKLATQIAIKDEEQQFWHVQLNICSSENMEKLWQAVAAIMKTK